MWYLAAAKMPRNNAISLSLGPEISEQSEQMSSDYKLGTSMAKIGLSAGSGIIFHLHDKIKVLT